MRHPPIHFCSSCQLRCKHRHSEYRPAKPGEDERRCGKRRPEWIDHPPKAADNAGITHRKDKSMHLAAGMWPSQIRDKRRGRIGEPLMCKPTE